MKARKMNEKYILIKNDGKEKKSNFNSKQSFLHLHFVDQFNIDTIILIPFCKNDSFKTGIYG